MARLPWRRRALEDVAEKAATRIAPPGSTVTAFTQQQLAGLQTLAQLFNGNQAITALPREDPQVPFGPGRPVVPFPIDPRLAGAKRPEPRRSEYPVGFNLPGVGANILPPFKALRQAADRCDIARRCIEVRKAQITSLTWDIRISKAAVDSEMADIGEKSPGKAAQSLRQRLTPAMADARVFWEKPDRINDLSFPDWVAMLLEELFVIDAVAIYPHFAKGGSLHSLELIAGDTIKPILDHRGAVPAPPQPAFQQLLYGFPRGEFTKSDDGVDAEFRTDQLVYRRRHARTWTPYGFSNVEQTLPAIDLYLKRQEWLRSEYTDGSVPEMFLQVDTKMTAEELQDYELAMNDMLAGNPAERRRIKLIPPGFSNPHQPASLEQRYGTEYDEHLIKLVCSGFDMQPAELGFNPKGGLGGKGFMEGQESATYRKAIRPTVTWLAGLLTDLSRVILGLPPELEFAFIGYEIEDQLQMEQTSDNRVRGGRSTLNDERADRGLPLYDFEEADEPFIVVGSGVTFLRGALKAQEAAATAAAQAATATPASPSDGGPAAEGPSNKPQDKADPQPKDDTAKAAELRAFQKWSAKGVARRPFTFETLTRLEAARLNEPATQIGDDSERACVTKALASEILMGYKSELHKAASIGEDAIAAAVAEVEATPGEGDDDHLPAPFPRWDGDEAALPQSDNPAWVHSKVRAPKIADLLASTDRLKRDDLIWHLEHPGRARETDWLYPLVAETDDGLVIVDGHHRIASALMLGDKRVPVYKLKVDA